MTMRFNLILLPEPAIVNEKLYACAASLKALADGYLLERGGAIPHITLSQFLAPDEKTAHEAAASLLDQKLSLSFRSFALRPGSHDHEGKLWAQYQVRGESALLSLQDCVLETLVQASFPVLTEAGLSYDPHATLARLPETFGSLPSGCVDAALFNVPFACLTALGVSDDNGQLLKLVK